MAKALLRIKYFTLHVDFLDGQGFTPQFGDKDRVCVSQERIDSYSGFRYRIVTWDGCPSDAEIQAANAELNAARQPKALAQ